MTAARHGYAPAQRGKGDAWTRAGRGLCCGRSGPRWPRCCGETEESESEAEQAPDSPTDFGDEGLALTEEEDEGDVADQLRERLAAIDRALARIEAGNYGLSVLSGKPIPAERLEADPAAELTIEEARAHR